MSICFLLGYSIIILIHKYFHKVLNILQPLVIEKLEIDTLYHVINQKQIHKALDTS